MTQWYLRYDYQLTPGFFLELGLHQNLADIYISHSRRESNDNYRDNIEKAVCWTESFGSTGSSVTLSPGDPDQWLVSFTVKCSLLHLMLQMM